MQETYSLLIEAVYSRNPGDTSMKTICIFGVVVATVLLWCAPVQCWAGDTAERSVRPAERFGRGLANILTSPLELPAQMYNRASYQQEHNNNPFAVVGGFLEGIPMGIIYFGWRLSAGCYDLFTFPFEACDQSIIDPEYVTFSYRVLLED